jgi:hypothetical protein
MPGNRILPLMSLAGLLLFGGGKSHGGLPQTAAPVARWQAENNARDSICGHDGVLINGAGFTEGKLGQGFNFDGNAQIVQVPASDAWDFTVHDGTIDFWAKVAVMPIFVAGFINQINNDSNWAIYFYSNGQLAVGRAGVNQILSPAGVVTPGAWLHLAVTKSSAGSSLYVNGAKVAQGPNDVWTSSQNPLRMGGHDYRGEYYLNGVMDEIDVFNRALSVEEIQSIYQAGGAGELPLTNLYGGATAWWPGDGTWGDVIGAHDVTPVGSVDYGAGRVGRAFHFNGSGAYLDAGDLRLPQAFSVALWVLSGSSNRAMTILSKGGGDTTRSYELAVDGDGRLWGTVDNSSGYYGYTQYFPASFRVTPGRWTHVVWTYDGGAPAGEKMHFFIDGAQVPASIGTYGGGLIADYGGAPFSDGNTLKIGVYGDGATGPFDGLIDELVLFSRALPPAEAVTVFRPDTAGFCLPPLPNLIVNGGFEAPVVPPGGATLDLATGWRAEALGPSPRQLVHGPDGGFPNAQDGDQYAALFSCSHGMVSQDFAVTGAGRYLLSWWDSTGQGQGPETAPYQLVVESAPGLAAVLAHLDAFHPGEWRPHALSVQLSPGSYRLSLESSSTACDGPPPLLDGVQLVPDQGASVCQRPPPGLWRLWNAEDGGKDALHLDDAVPHGRVNFPAGLAGQGFGLDGHGSRTQAILRCGVVSNPRELG